MSAGDDAQTAPTVRERLIAGAITVLDEAGLEALSVRRVAQASGRSTMCVYTKFGSRGGMVSALREHAAEELLRALGAPAAEPGREALTAVLGAYRAFAAAQPGLFALLFDGVPQSVVDAPDAEGVAAPDVEGVAAPGQGLAAVLSRIAAAVGGGEECKGVALRLWAGQHGMVVLERQWPPGLEVPEGEPGRDPWAAQTHRMVADVIDAARL